MAEIRTLREVLQAVVSSIQTATQTTPSSSAKTSGGSSASRASSSQRGSGSGSSSTSRASGSRSGDPSSRGGTTSIRQRQHEVGLSRKPVSAARRQAQGERSGSNSQAQQKGRNQSTASRRTTGASRSQSTQRSNIPSHQSGSYLRMNVSNAKKRDLLEQELDRIQVEKTHITTARQKDALSFREKNVVHQLQTLDAAAGKEPGRYASKDAELKKAVTVDGVKPNAKTDSDAAKKAEEAAKNVPEVRAFGAGRVMTTEDERRRAEQEQAAVEERYQKNLAIEKEGLSDCKDSTGHINGQAYGAVATMSFGPTIDEKVSDPAVNERNHNINKMFTSNDFGTVANAGCESIAVYNTLHDLGKDMSLSQIIYDTERNGHMLWNGWLGTKIYKVDDILKQYGVESKAANSSDVQKSADSGELKEGQIYVASILNNKNAPLKGFEGIHTFEIVYSPNANADKPWTVYNRNEEKDGKKYATVDDILEDRTSGKYISMLEIKR